MDKNTLLHRASGNLDRLGVNQYPGRGIVLGFDTTGTRAVMVYWIMGRSENSRSRVFTQDGERLFTEPTDPSKIKDPSLVIYNAMDRYSCDHVVSNGDHTDTVIEWLRVQAGATLSNALKFTKFEPDAPNFTPRIAGMCRISDGKCVAELAILRRSEFVQGRCIRSYYEYRDIEPGIGFCLTTYCGDGIPLPAFVGEPYPVLIEGTSNQSIASEYVRILNKENMVALAVKTIELETGRSAIAIINKYEKIASLSPA
jgi:IMP cyclohydrolase